MLKIVIGILWSASSVNESCAQGGDLKKNNKPTPKKPKEILFFVPFISCLSKQTCNHYVFRKMVQEWEGKYDCKDGIWEAWCRLCIYMGLFKADDAVSQSSGYDNFCPVQKRIWQGTADFG